MKILKKMARPFREKPFPGAKGNREMVKKWQADGGDAAFRFSYDLDERSLVLDLGGYEGQWASDLFSRYGCRIAVFEPVESFAKAISLRFAKNAKIEVLALGLGASTRPEQIHMGRDASSLFGASGSGGSTETVRIVDAKDWFAERSFPEVALMKVNIEGGEYELLDRMAATGLLPLVVNLQVQFHEIAPDSHARMEKIRETLRRTHRPTYQYEFVWENWERLPVAG